MGQGHACVKNNDGDARSGMLSELVREATGTSPSNCYQCGRCAAGCPQNLPGEMDISPTRIMHLLQLEAAFSEEPELAARYAAQALTAETPWLCVGWSGMHHALSAGRGHCRHDGRITAGRVEMRDHLAQQACAEHTGAAPYVFE